MVDSDELIKFLFYNINFLNVTYSTYLILECMTFIRERILGIVTFLFFCSWETRRFEREFYIWL